MFHLQTQSRSCICGEKHITWKKPCMCHLATSVNKIKQNSDKFLFACHKYDEISVALWCSDQKGTSVVVYKWAKLKHGVFMCTDSLTTINNSQDGKILDQLFSSQFL